MADDVLPRLFVLAARCLAHCSTFLEHLCQVRLPSESLWQFVRPLAWPISLFIFPLAVLLFNMWVVPCRLSGARELDGVALLFCYAQTDSLIYFFSEILYQARPILWCGILRQFVRARARLGLFASLTSRALISLFARSGPRSLPFCLSH